MGSYIYAEAPNLAPAATSSSNSRMSSSSHYLYQDHDDSVDSDTESDALSTASMPLFSAPPSVTSSQTSYDAAPSSIRSASPAPSIISMADSMRSQIYRSKHGREFNNFSDVYALPADEEEMDRLDQQHFILIDVMGGKYAPPMVDVMADDVPGERKACLDLGCGSGGWIIDVARDFPNCDAVAVDLIPMQSSSMPPNLRSEVDDINLGLEHYYGDFNVVHVRLVSSGVKDYYRLIDQISNVLRPGGLIDIAEFDFHIYDENHQRLELETHQIGPPWWARWLTFVNAAIRQNGGHTDAATHLWDWVSNHPAFEEPVYREFWMPVCNAPGDSDFQKELCQRMASDVLSFLKGTRALLLGHGLAEDLVTELVTNAEAEHREGKIPQYSRLQCVYARKNNGLPRFWPFCDITNFSARYPPLVCANCEDNELETVDRVASVTLRHFYSFKTYRQQPWPFTGIDPFHYMYLLCGCGCAIKCPH